MKYLEIITIALFKLKIILDMETRNNLFSY